MKRMKRKNREQKGDEGRFSKAR